MSNSEIPVEVVSLDIDPSGHGTLRARYADLPAFIATVARIGPGTILFDSGGRAHHLQLAESEPVPPVAFPCEVGIAVVETEPTDEVRERMLLGNDYLRAAYWVEVIQFDPPDKDGGPGLLRVQCDTAEDYQQLRRFLDEPHGSGLKSLRGDVWLVHRISDNGQVDQAFPQKFNVVVEWLEASLT
jgi:hypothetical protein